MLHTFYRKASQQMVFCWKSLAVNGRQPSDISDNGARRGAKQAFFG